MRLAHVVVAVVAALALASPAGGASPAVTRAADATIAPAERADYRSAGTWSELFDEESPANRAPVLAWALALVVLGLVGAPYAWLAAAALPDRGYAFARPLGLLLVGWLSWLGAHTGTVPATRGGILLALAVAAGGALAIVAAGRRPFAVWLRARWRVLAAAELVFWVFFAAAVLVRWANPDLWHPARGGEKPMDMAFLNAVVKSEAFPPHDPWFADGVINYYYFGFVLAGTLVELTGVVPAVAYNLAVPTFYGLVAVSAFGAASALAGRRRRRRGPTVAAGLAGAVLVALVGNLAELRLVVQRMRETLPPEAWFWNASRAIDHAPTEPGPITEFPAFTFLFADLHAHAMALPYTLLVVGLAAAAAAPVGATRGRVGGVVLAALLALALGALWPLNTWDVPTYALVVLLAFAVREPARPLPWRAAAAAARWLAVVALAWVAFAPFHLSYASSFAGFERWRGSRTALGDYVTVHGAFLLVVATALVVELAVARDAGAFVRLLRLAIARPRRIGRLLSLHRALVRVRPAYALPAALATAGAALAGALALARLGVPALVVALATVTGLAAARDRRRAAPDPLWTLALALFAVGLALTLAVELVVARAIDVGRMNTVFKLYLQVWTLWALVAAVAVLRVHARLPRLGRPFRVAWSATLAALLAATLLYPALAVPARIADRLDPTAPRTLDGTAFMRAGVHHERDRPLRLRHDLEAIRWLQRNVRGSPVVAEVNTFPMLYGWGSRFAVHTGNPTIVGWEWHERQQRFAAPPGTVERRVADVQRLYETTDARLARRLLDRYGVRYVVVGELERTYFPGGSAKWAEAEGRLWRTVYRNAAVAIYEPLDPPAGG